jgi:hypothetical protein
VTREELARVVMSLGLQRFDPIISSFTLPGFRRPVSLVPTVTREDEVVLNNVRRIMAFLAAAKVIFQYVPGKRLVEETLFLPITALKGATCINNVIQIVSFRKWIHE